MPNVDFERSLISSRLANTLEAADLKRRLLSIKTYLDYEDADIVRLNFLDTLRPELWCIEGLARHLEPLPGQQYGLDLIENLPRIAVRFLNVPQGKSTWVLYVQVDADRAIFDDSYYLKKVKDQVGFSSRQNIDITVTPGMEQAVFVNPMSDEDDELPLTLTPGTNTVVITAYDQRIGAWLLFAFLCNYLDRGYKALGFASSLDEKEIFAKWSAFVISDQQILETFGFQPDPEKFRTVMQNQHYQMHYDPRSQVWHVSPPIFRFDLIHPIDILEDYLVATGYNFDEIQPTVLTSINKAGSQTKRSALEERLVNYMQADGARQTIGLFLDSYENLVERMCHNAPERLIRLVNAVNKNREYAVDSSLPPLLRNAVHPTAPVPPTVFYLFTETVFLDEKRVAHSRWKMGILLVGTEHPFNNAHTLLDALCYHLHLDYTLKRSTSPALISGRQMTVFVDDMPIGQFGEVHPEVLTRWELFYPTSFIELDVDSITAMWDGSKA